MSYTYDYQPATKGKYWNLPDQSISGFVIHSIGCPQPKAQVLVNNFNKSTTSASVHGFIEPGLYIETAPTRVAQRKAKKCYHVGSGVNGSWNSSRIGIEMCEPSTIVYTGGASFRDNNPAATRDYVERVTATAAEVFADLCIFHNLSVATISSHAEAYKKGYGSNHGDPDHIWKHIGYSLERFRQDVQAIIDSKKGDAISNMTIAEFNKILDNKFAAFDSAFDQKLSAMEKRLTPVTYKYLEDVPEWARPSVKKCLDNGIMTGTGKDANGKVTIDLTVDLTRSIVLLDKAGQFDTEKTVEEK